MMKLTDLAPAFFDFAAQIWAIQEALPADTAPDMNEGDLLDIADNIQIAIANAAPRLPAKDAADIEFKQRVADHIDGIFDDDLVAKLRQSVAFDRARLGIPATIRPASLRLPSATAA